jgi:multidrug efflux pump subunit AcrB
MVLLATFVFVVWGLGNYYSISRREDPEIKISVALVVTIYPGASAEKVEKQVTQKLEEQIESMESLEEVKSTTRENISVIFVSVRYDSDAEMEWQKLRSRVAEISAKLPKGIIGPKVWDEFGDTTGMIIALTGAKPTELADIAEELKNELRRVPSVGEMTIYGEQPEVVYVEGTRAMMAQHSITPYRMSQALQMHNLEIPAGYIKTPQYKYRVQPTGAYSSIEEIEETIIDVSMKTANPVHVEDLFDVRRSIKTPFDTKVLKDGRTALALGIVMKKGYNMVEMGGEVRDVLARFRKRLPPEVSVEVVHDAPRQVDQRIQTFMQNLLEGLAIVVVSMALFLGLRSAIIAAVAIPLSVLIAMSFMPLMEIDLELVSISAFIVALGMLVDNSIIVSDNVDLKLRAGLSPQEAAWRGTHELARPVVAGTLATVVAFMPMLLLEAEIGAYVRSLPLVVAASLIGSLLVSMTLTPYMAKKMLRAPKKKKPFGRGPIARGYRRFLRLCLRHRWAVVLATMGLLGFAGYLFFQVGFSFFPDANRDQFTVDIWLKEGTAVAETERIAKQADAMLRADEEVDSTLVYVGKGGPRFYITVVPEFQKTNYAQIMVNTVDESATHRVVDRFNDKAQKMFPGARVFAKKMVMGVPVQAPIAIRITGPDLRKLRRISRQIQDILEQTPGTVEVRDNIGPDVPSFKVEVDEERANRVGVTNTDVALAFLSTYQGFELTSFDDGDEEIPVILRLEDTQRRIREDLAGLPVFSNITKKQVPLGNIADIEPQWGAGVIRRYDNRRSVSVLAWNKGRLADDVLKDAWPEIQALNLPPGYKLEIAGEKKEMDSAFRQLLIVFGVIIASLVGLLVLQLSSMRKTIVVLLAVPLALIGASVGLYLGSFSFSFMAFLGVVALAGMVIKNSVVWIEFVDRAEDQGKDRTESVVEAGIFRLRPIMLTTVTTVGGLLPLGLFGGVLFEPMAWAMIGGLLASTVLILIVVPVFFTLIAPPPKETRSTEKPTTEKPTTEKPSAGKPSTDQSATGKEQQAGSDAQEAEEADRPDEAEEAADQPGDGDELPDGQEATDPDDGRDTEADSDGRGEREPEELESSADRQR